MQADVEIFDFLKSSLDLESDLQLMGWLGISRDSLSGIRTGRLPMGDSIRFQILRKWWVELRPSLRSSSGMGDQAADATSLAIQNAPDFSVKSTLENLRVRLAENGKQLPPGAESGTTESMPVDAELLEAYKVYKSCATDTELASLLGIKRQSISMVRSGRNGLGPIPLLKIFEDAMGTGDLGLQAAVQSSQALLLLITRVKDPDSSS